jgi:hypothetical protein
MAMNANDLVSELRTLLAGRRGDQDLALGTLTARTLELAELVQKQGEKIKEFEQRLDL